MAANAVSFVVEKLTGFAMNRIWSHFESMFCYDSKIETLRDKVKALETKESEVQDLVVEAKRNAETIKPGVTDWLKKVDDLKKQAYEVLESETNSEMQCLSFICPNLKTRYSLGRKATEKTSEVAKLLEERTLFQKVGEPKPPVQLPRQKPGDFGAFETRILRKKEIMDALKDKDVSIIGICGMGGVGKTTMAKEIAKEAKTDRLFEEFAWADISGDPKVTKIQDELAERLGLNIKDTTNESVRAERLCERLGGDRSKSILVILDDVWEDTVLETIGVPVPSAGNDKGLKILLTSRDKDVCGKMRAQRIFDVGLLNEKESWELFKEKAEISDDATNVIKDTAENIAKECDGLPLALVTVGRALCRKEEHVWKNALVELRSSAVTNINRVHELYSRIKLSYDYLESDEAKSLLLRCSLYPEDDNIEIEDLVRCACGLELFGGSMTLITTRDRVNTIVDHLRSCSLLLSTENKDCVRLHDVVRDVCLQIASKDNMSKHTGLKEWPKHDNNKSYSAISPTSDELNQLPSGLEYPNLKFLRVICNEQSVNISKEFFANMKELRVLDFARMKIQIPSSIQMLTNLRTLCLDYCALNTENSTVGNLKKLEVLSFCGSALYHFPEDIAQLSNLRSLDLRFKHSSSFCPLPHGILLQLKKLEELYLGVVEIRDDELEQRGYIIEEISSLTDLNTFQISTNDPQFLLQILRVLCIEQLGRFHIELTDSEAARRNMVVHYDFGRRLHIRGITYASVLSEPEINSLMRRTDHLSIKMNTNDLDDHSLQVMERKSDGFEYLNGNHLTEAFDGLQEITLEGIPKMKHLFRGVIKPPSLHNLKNLDIESCPSLKSLFSESIASCMVNLQDLTISRCEMLEEVISMDTEQNEVTQMLEFRKLQTITLWSLRNFKSFRYGSNKTVGMLNPLFKQVSLPNLESLQIHGCPSLKSLFSESVASCTVNLQSLKISNCEMLEEVISMDTEQSEVTQMLEFPKLQSIVFWDLSNFKSFRCGSSMIVGVLNPLFKQVSLPNLESLEIQGCPSLKSLFSESVASCTVNLQSLKISNCEMLEEVISMDTEQSEVTQMFEFPKLQSIVLRDLSNFKSFRCGSSKIVGVLNPLFKQVSLPYLESLEIQGCPSLKSLFSESVASCTVNLQSLKISNCEMLEEDISMDTEQSEVTQMLEFPKLQSIDLGDLSNFKSFRCGSSMIVGVLNPLFKQVSLPNLEWLCITRLGCTVTIMDVLKQIRSHHLRQLEMFSLDDVSILFDFEYTKDDEEISILGQLTSLDVTFLPKLVHITRMFPKGSCVFKNLTCLKVGDCDNLRYLFSPSMANSLVALEDVMVMRCKAIEEIIGRQEEDDTSNIEIVEEGTTSRIVFPKLRNLTLIHLDRLGLLSSQNYELAFPSLDYLRIKNCPMMTKFCSRQSAPKLDKVWINSEQSIDISNFYIEGSILMWEDHKFVDTSSDVEDAVEEFVPSKRPRFN